MIRLSNKWAEMLRKKPEAGMGFQIATVVLRDGRRFNRVVVDSGHITRVGDISDIPFKEDEISEIIVTNDK